MSRLNDARSGIKYRIDVTLTKSFEGATDAPIHGIAHRTSALSAHRMGRFKDLPWISALVKKFSHAGSKTSGSGILAFSPVAFEPAGKASSRLRAYKVAIR